MIRPILIATSLLIAGCAASATPPDWTTALSRDHPLVGTIWRTETSNYVTQKELVQALSRADLVYLGEKHDNPDHHLLQAWLIEQLADSGKRPAVVLEMVAEDRQDAIDAHIAAKPKDASGLGLALAWDKSGWPSWSEYQPVADAALRHGLPLIAGNLPRRTTRAVGRNGVSALPETRQKRLRLDQPVTDSYRDTMLEIVAQGHCGLMPREALAPMVAVQQVRDAVLADNLLRALARDGTDSAVLIAGGGHARRDLGAPAAAATMQAGLRSISVAFIEAEESSKAPGDYAGNYFAGTLPFDFVWFTPRANDRDYCAELKKRFSGHGAKKKP